ncbi:MULTISPECIES: LPXTG cell wall anchor domain-containing protein [unclassified Nocardioides]|uniref:LPXTG cell wall anchor domain-containing protein n=1 Tax=unclassified Nocardioides TaxID=2615069 RepID=UPI0007027A39|nr:MULTISPECIES: LPXTG cell wall anchor domain-containing protein [unclassified Nocardioides]KRC48991.1 hypothetical protein ASE19_19040 [Nocardioides sp. Root79]KRC75392.1 hypothetical protein ASE20_20945 [Nocardioides sp. Root240]
MIRRLAVPIGAIAAAVVTLVAAPAHADDEIGLSRDGVTWSTELTAPLFDPDFRFVPGDQEVRSFRVRNDGPSAGVLTVDVIASDPDLLLADDDFTLEARIGNGPWLSVGAGTTRAVTELKVAEGAQTRVSVRATFDWDSTRQVQSVPFRVHLNLAEDGDVGGVDNGNGDGDGGDGDVGGEDDALPSTGAAVAPGLLWLAAGLIGSGLALLRRRDRREEASNHVQA